jgi:hypothetical protein
MRLVALQLSVPGWYLPPGGNLETVAPPQMIISLPVHTAVCDCRASGASVMLVAVQLSGMGLYLPPVLKSGTPPSNPPHTIISLPVQTAVWNNRPAGALVVLVAVQLSVPGSYLPPVFKGLLKRSNPPHTIISLPVHVHTAVCQNRPSGALVVLVAVQLSVTGLYLPPVLRRLLLLSLPPQMIISLPVHTAVCP